ncbi:MAG: EAL domain-containing protein [Paraburkholderia sp.]|uniref:EAL domain-containing protein n=1 Tax=Paraburkholderia sp. TaxID=1926495 RepID=UPI00121824AE|nr:EAL domain-containing protein [Paraburkholderia sp.]TAM08044.1 MAG: EAL domain-containing protein [Paraburkholderia sp.]TAM30050.1 MAG: EAL domain-containing protein [Paraburkholderia sp.]
MDHKSTVLTTFCLVALTVTAVVGIAIYATDVVIEQRQRLQVDSYSERALLRAERVTDEAESALREAARYGDSPCTDDHLRLLKQTEAARRYIRDVGYTDGQTLRCSTLSATGGGDLPPPEWTDAYGFSAWHSEVGRRGAKQSMLNIRYGNHLVVIDPRFYVDIVPLNDALELGVVETQDATVITRWPRTSESLVRAAVQHDLTTGYEAGRYYVVERSRRYPLAIVAYEPAQRIRPSWFRQMSVFIVPALVVGGLATWFVLTWRRELRTPRNSLLEGIRRRQFVVWFQPIVALDSGRCIGAEALVRWQLADGTIIAPDSFIPMAESVGLIQPITDQVIRSVFEGAGNLLAQRRDLHVSINLTRDDLETSRMMETLQACLVKYDVHPNQIWFEAVERAFLDAKRFAPVLERYRAAGFRILIDDFGTGFSSLAYLQELPVDGIKIDKVFMHALVTGTEVNAILPHIVAMAQSLNLLTVAEGVETETQARWLRTHNVGYAQGWLYAKAMPADAFARYVRAVPPIAAAGDAVQPG